MPGCESARDQAVTDCNIVPAKGNAQVRPERRCKSCGAQVSRTPISVHLRAFPTSKQLPSAANSEREGSAPAPVSISEFLEDRDDAIKLFGRICRSGEASTS
eukprot:scaffold1355_cov268-Pinguiococcus_pyrenoidosus.AAC.64